ncbi:hypothetical protein DS745_21605 [Anaerobacillus alkaliphilus]|uniref:Uncharacterized protein n=1 Tax=Anaerobacillus alkaliphilus TaxID=1548597 RepID=A0A4Q0VND4_9BACI|nr:type II toxin-antitoxin system PemK/MazF family toxin [Anaerobacillus alkaliphilus]RXI96322.1 hypothetical protein DS745_21605 [Anaerobacillus alkaliphilus]
MYYLSDTEQPLKFIVRKEDGTISIEKRNGNFDPIVVDGNKRAVEQNVLITVKPRQAIILSNDVINRSDNFSYVEVAPVFGLTERNSEELWYEDLINDRLEGFAFISKGRYGIEVDLTQITTIHKSMLLKKQTMVPKHRMDFIESQILEQLDL